MACLPVESGRSRNSKEKVEREERSGGSRCTQLATSWTRKCRTDAVRSRIRVGCLLAIKRAYAGCAYSCWSAEQTDDNAAREGDEAGENDETGASRQRQVDVM